MNDVPADAQLEKALDILESNFQECLKHLHRYITVTLATAAIYAALLVSPQAVDVPGVPVSVEGTFAFGLLGALYVAVGGMATFVAERATRIANTLFEARPVRFRALRLGPSIGTTDVPVVRLLVSFVPALILAGHAGYEAYRTSSGGIWLAALLYLSVGLTLWTLLPIGKQAAERHTLKR